jgi:hypothetical protein
VQVPQSIVPPQPSPMGPQLALADLQSRNPQPLEPPPPGVEVRPELEPELELGREVEKLLLPEELPPLDEAAPPEEPPPLLGPPEVDWWHPAASARPAIARKEAPVRIIALGGGSRRRQSHVTGV